MNSYPDPHQLPIPDTERARRRIANKVAWSLATQTYRRNVDRLLAELADEASVGREQQLLERWLRFLQSRHVDDL